MKTKHSLKIKLFLTICDIQADSGVKFHFHLGFFSVLKHVWRWLRFLTTDRTFTNQWNQPEGSSSSRPWHWQNTSMQWAENVPPPPLIPPRPGDLQPHPLPTSPQPSKQVELPARQETTNTNPFPEGRSQNQLLGVVFTNKAVLWGLRLRLGVEQ